MSDYLGYIEDPDSDLNPASPRNQQRDSYTDEGTPDVAHFLYSDEGVPFWGDLPGAWDVLMVAGKKFPGIARITGNGCQHRHDKQKSAGKAGAKYVFLGTEPAEFETVLKLWTRAHLHDFQDLVALIKPEKKRVARVGDTASGHGATVDYGADDNIISGMHGGLSGDATYTAMARLAGKPLPGAGFGELREREYRDQVAEQKKAKAAADAAKKVAAVAGPKALDVSHPNLRLFRISSAVCISSGFLEPQSDGTFTVKMKWVEYYSPKKRAASAVTSPSGSKYLENVKRNAFDVRGDEIASRAKPSDKAGP